MYEHTKEYDNKLLELYDEIHDAADIGGTQFEYVIKHLYEIHYRN
jgi:hypothetical protein